LNDIVLLVIAILMLQDPYTHNELGNFNMTKHYKKSLPKKENLVKTFETAGMRVENYLEICKQIVGNK